MIERGTADLRAFAHVELTIVRRPKRRVISASHLGGICREELTFLGNADLRGNRRSTNLKPSPNVRLAIRRVPDRRVERTADLHPATDENLPASRRLASHRKIRAGRTDLQPSTEPRLPINRGTERRRECWIAHLEGTPGPDLTILCPDIIVERPVAYLKPSTDIRLTSEGPHATIERRPAYLHPLTDIHLTITGAHTRIKRRRIYRPRRSAYLKPLPHERLTCDGPNGEVRLGIPDLHTATNPNLTVDVLSKIDRERTVTHLGTTCNVKLPAISRLETHRKGWCHPADLGAAPEPRLAIDRRPQGFLEQCITNLERLPGPDLTILSANVIIKGPIANLKPLTDIRLAIKGAYATIERRLADLHPLPHIYLSITGAHTRIERCEISRRRPYLKPLTHIRLSWDSSNGKVRRWIPNLHTATNPNLTIDRRAQGFLEHCVTNLERLARPDLTILSSNVHVESQSADLKPLTDIRLTIDVLPEIHLEGTVTDLSATSNIELPAVSRLLANCKGWRDPANLHPAPEPRLTVNRRPERCHEGRIAHLERLPGPDLTILSANVIIKGPIAYLKALTDIRLAIKRTDGEIRRGTAHLHAAPNPRLTIYSRAKR